MSHVEHNPRQLPQVLRLFDIAILASASMGPAYSLASTMGPMVVAAGTAAVPALAIMGAIMLCIAISFARLSRVAPNAGSSYSWIRMAFGDRAGAYGAWLLLLSNFFATMATAVPAGIYTLALVAPKHAEDPIWAACVGAIWILASATLLYLGLRPTAFVTTIAVLFEFVVLGAAAAASYFYPHPATTASVAHLPAIPLSLAGFLGAMTLAVWMVDGWELSAATSEEVDRDPRASGRGGIAGLLMTTVVLLVGMTAFMHLGSVSGFNAHEADALAYVADLLGGYWWHFAIILTVLISTSSALWTTILYLSRSVYAMGRDGLLPAAIGTLDRRNEPLWSLAAIAVLVAAAELATGFSPSAGQQLELVLNASSVFLGLLFVFSAASAVRRFWRDERNRLTGVAIPLIGAIALLGVLGATIVLEPLRLQWYAWGGILLGIPFALWRGAALRHGRGRP